MIEEFLRPPRGASEVAADLLRLVGLISVIVAAIAFQATDAGVLAFVLPGLLLPRFIGARPGFDIVYCALLLIAGWSNVLDLYTSVTWWDIPVHFTCVGAIAAMLHLLLTRLSIVTDPGTAPFPSATAVVSTTTIGVTVATLWEMVEWFGKTFVSTQIFVEYNDTIGDLAVGTLGAISAGIVVGLVRLQRGPR